MRNINIVLMAHRRPEFSDFMIRQLGRAQYKDRVHLSILICDQNQHHGQPLVDLATSLGISSHYKPFRAIAENYMNKIKEAVGIEYEDYYSSFGHREEQFEYSVKLDEDVFLSPSGWDYFITNIPVVLDNPSNAVYTMSLSNGIPTVDHFIHDNMNAEDQIKMNQMFSQTYIPNLWGANYEHLNAAIAGNYDSQKFFTAAYQINHHYKGIHPIRASKEAQKVLNDWLLAHPEKFFIQNSWFNQTMTEPYFCNSFFAIKTSTWKNVLETPTLFRDAFDEVAINNYRHWNGKNFIVARGGFAIHTLYNTLFTIPGNSQPDLMKYEFDFVDELKKIYDAYGA